MQSFMEIIRIFRQYFATKDAKPCANEYHRLYLGSVVSLNIDSSELTSNICKKWFKYISIPAFQEIAIFLNSASSETHENLKQCVSVASAICTTNIMP